MTERLQNNPEQDENTQEKALENAEHERLANEREQNAERSLEKNEADAKREALEAATKVEKEVTEQDQAPAEKHRDTPARRRVKQKANFNKTMKEAQAHMSPTAR